MTAVTEQEILDEVLRNSQMMFAQWHRELEQRPKNDRARMEKDLREYNQTLVKHDSMEIKSDPPCHSFLN